MGLAYSPSGYGLDWADKLKRVHIRALPLYAGQQTQDKLLTLEKIAEKDVTRVFFNMNLETVPEKHEWEIKNR